VRRRLRESYRATDAFYKAQTLAYWSFSGLIIPIVGVILGAMSRSRLRLLTSNNADEQAEIDRTRRVATWGFGVSLGLLILYVVSLLAWGFMIGFSFGKVHDNGTSPNSSVSNTNSILGSLTLHDPSSFSSLQSGDTCAGSGGYSDITEGAQVVASDGSGNVLAVSQLEAGQADGSGNCNFSFELDNVSHATYYKFEVSQRGEVDYSYQQLSAGDFNVAMTLGE
jgi:hypothetical protein